MDPYFQQQQKASEECRTMGGKSGHREHNLLIDFYHLRRSKEEPHAKMGRKKKNSSNFQIENILKIFWYTNGRFQKDPKL